MNHDVLYLGSQSRPRQDLLKIAGITFQVLQHKSSEDIIQPSNDFEKYVISIACDKMQHLQLPDPNQIKDNRLFVLTADTLIKLVATPTLGEPILDKPILGKPKNMQDAKRMLKLMQNHTVHVLTGCCLRTMKKVEQHWEIEKQDCWATGAHAEFIVDDQSMDLYFQREPWAMHACGAGVIEGFGQVFLKSINGSYSAVLGLPLFELRHKLVSLGFKF